MSSPILIFPVASNCYSVPPTGIFTLDVRPDGTLYIHFLPCTELKRALNSPDGFHGHLLNRNNIGKSSQELVDQWNQEHPEDPLEE